MFKVSLAHRTSMIMIPVLMLVGCTHQPARVQAADLDVLTGQTWAGTLTYKDYQSGQPTTIRSTLAVDRVAQRDDAWDFRIGYDDEPHANRASIVVLSAGGGMLDDEPVVERTPLKDGEVRVVTESDGKDNDRPARLRHVYVLGKSRCSLQKLVRFDGAKEFFERNVYNWSREGN